MVETTTTAAVQAADFVRLEAAGHVDCATLLPVRTPAARQQLQDSEGGKLPDMQSITCWLVPTPQQHTQQAVPASINKHHHLTEVLS
jgi:hypothetical protein